MGPGSGTALIRRLSLSTTIPFSGDDTSLLIRLSARLRLLFQFFIPLCFSSPWNCLAGATVLRHGDCPIRHGTTEQRNSRRDIHSSHRDSQHVFETYRPNRNTTAVLPQQTNWCLGNTSFGLGEIVLLRDMYVRMGIFQAVPVFHKKLQKTDSGFAWRHQTATR